MHTAAITLPSRASLADDLPCAGAYARLAEVLPGLRVEPTGPRSGGGWITAAEIAGDPRVPARLVAEEEQRGLADYGEPLRPDVAAGFSLHRYAWSACLLFTVPWFLERRVPRLPVTAVSVNRAGGRMAVRVDSFACLPGDPAAGLPGARVVADEAALRAKLLAALTEHLEPLLAAFRPRLRRGPRTLWGMATDEVVEGLWYVGGLLGEEQRAAAELDLLLPGSTAPFAGGAGFRMLDQGPDRAPMRTRTRVTCCLYYTVRPAEVCFNCPRSCRDPQPTGRTDK
ncbi:(2Fe-2S)-binding protein [Peterkaempfera griseoplana]|uniref:(2Fe-2S)-binding protein n=1 Tax=Peterkaempfera griseoplana TaxID=66896 RepID=UPI0006E2A9EF|nr:(2Fe-2S)-binding protein [Peterkaempfera griseoplana]